MTLKAPFPYFGGKRDLAIEVWRRFGDVRQYIEPFCGSAAVLLAAPSPASLEVVCDWSGFIANFWRSVVHQADAVARWADYPVSHVDLGARHRWLMERRETIGLQLQDPEWPGDAKVAGWWLWGQCSWIGSGWCEWAGKVPGGAGQVPHLGNAGMGVQAAGQVPHLQDAGRGVLAIGKIPNLGNASRGVAAIGQIPFLSSPGMDTHAGSLEHGDPVMWTSSGRTALMWLRRISSRMERVRVVHGDWSRCMNHHYGGESTAVFFDPPYVAFEGLYGGADSGETTVAKAVEAWCLEYGGGARVALCGHRGDYDLPGWSVMEWSRSRLTYGGGGTTDEECVWFSPSCINVERGQSSLMF